MSKLCPKCRGFIRHIDPVDGEEIYCQHCDETGYVKSKGDSYEN